MTIKQSTNVSLKFTIIPRVHTRRTSYNLRDVVKAIQDAGLTYQRPIFLIQVIVNTLEERKKLEHNLKRVHRNIPYTVETVKEPT